MLESEKPMRDLFDVLGIGFREDAYITLLANVFEEPQGALSNELEQLLGDTQPADPKEKITVVQDALDKVLREVKETSGTQDR